LIILTAKTHDKHFKLVLNTFIQAQANITLGA